MAQGKKRRLSYLYAAGITIKRNVLVGQVAEGILHMLSTREGVETTIQSQGTATSACVLQRDYLLASYHTTHESTQ